ncbi:putative Mitochondrial processing peptidase [Candidatus Zixiibacteriota bacterium]|nr:putative Mitochondrial processing peptidase [candidate division Zixibacteria bacterium]
MKKFPIIVLLPVVFFIFVSVSIGGGITPASEQFSLGNGLKVVAWEDHEQPMVHFSLLVKCGPATDSARLSGLAALTSLMLREGTAKFPGTRLVEVIDSVGGVLTPLQDEKDALLFEGNFMSRDLALGMKILGEMMAHPLLPEESLERLKKRLVSVNLQHRSLPQILMKDEVYRAFYDNRGYGLSNWGRVSTINRITIDDVRKFYRDNFAPGNCVLLIAGDFAIKDLKKIIGASFAVWSSNGKCWGTRGSASIPDTSKIILIDNPASPGVDFALGRTIVPASSPDFPSLALLNYILGGGGRVSRLFQNLIVNKSSATYISSSLDLSRGDGMIFISGATTRNAVIDAINGARETLDELRRIRIPVKELDGAKYYYRGYFASLYETPQSSVDVHSRLLSHGVSFDFHDKLLAAFNRVDVNRLRDVAEHYLDYNNYIVIIYGSEAALKNSLQQLGPVEVIKLGQE